MNNIELFAFDLDGTLLDTAPDFLYAVNILREKYNLSAADFDQVRSRVSQGAASLASYALGLETESDEKIEFHRQELLEIYEDCCLKNTIIFDGIEDVLDKLNSTGTKWGIITNKPRRFAEIIVQDKLSKFSTHFLICPDDVAKRKPDPDGLKLALEISDSNPKNSIYIGDHRIDIIAGEQANMITGAAAYGYIPLGDSAKDWKADYLFNQPKEINDLLVK